MQRALGDIVALRMDGAVGDGLWLDGLTIHPKGQPAGETVPSGNPPPELMALRSLGLLLFNLNEFACID